MMMFRRVLVMVLFCQVAGCALVQPRDPPVVRVVGMQALPSEGLELRFELRLRVQNPREEPIKYDGIAVSLDLDGRGLASGVSDAKGTVARFGEAVVEVPVTISLFSALREALARAGDLERGTVARDIPYAMTGRFGGSGLGGVRFRSEGKLTLPGTPARR